MQQKAHFIRTLALIPILMTFLLTSGCAGWSWKYMQEETALSVKNGTITGTAPAGWMFFPTMNNNRIILSKNGMSAHYVQVFKTPYGSLQTKESPISDDTLLTNLADYYITEHKNRKKEIDLDLLTKEIVTINETDYVKLHLTYKTGDGLIFDLIAHAFNRSGHLNEIVYETPRLYLKDRDLVEVERFVNTVRFVDKS